MARTLTSLPGNTQRLDGGAMFGNAPKALWTRWIAADEHNTIPLACRALLVEDDGRRILFETGIGAFFSPRLKERYGVVETDHMLLRSLEAVGLQQHDIDVVVLSHLHFDHAGGLLAPYSEGQPLRLLFERAVFVTGARGWQRALKPHPRDRASFVPELITLLAESGRLELVDGDSSPTLGRGYRFLVSDGHTPGMLLSEIDMPGGPVVFAADLVPGTAWVHVPITMGYDRYPEKVIDEKQALLADMVQRRGRLFYTHDAHVALSRIRVDEHGRYSTNAPLDTIRRLAH